ncbi:unnamed protein product, partial [Larinioides sclopetarius]
SSLNNPPNASNFASFRPASICARRNKTRTDCRNSGSVVAMRARDRTNLKTLPPDTRGNARKRSKAFASACETYRACRCTNQTMLQETSVQVAGRMSSRPKHVAFYNPTNRK